MNAKPFRFGRLSSSQFNEKTKELNDFLQSVDVIGTPQLTSNDEEGTVVFVFYTDKSNKKSIEVKDEASSKSNSKNIKS